ncbi:hypothetical protein CRG98_011123 [Punica granatum]|uniref:Uncharacterized protein n=1 Tax=Punica granatum TaxID=22663 RepID=A0A2I0KIZ4_PUNGR|nr:hypothetical protein CRG98_011123 [Punica granatum]
MTSHLCIVSSVPFLDLLGPPRVIVADAQGFPSSLPVIADVAGPIEVAATRHDHLPFSLELNTISSHTSYLLISVAL